MEDADYVVIGKIGSTFGIKGWVKILSYTEWTTQILEYSPWYIENGAAWKTIELTDSREHGKGIIVKIAGFDTPEQTRLLAGKKIAISRSQLPALAEDEYYWSDLEGLTVINQDGINLGKVIYLIATGSNDVLVVKGDKEHAIPYLLKEVIVRVDLENQVIYVNWDIL